MTNILGLKGSVMAKITTYGKPFNGSVINFVGENAVHKMTKIINRLEDLRKIKADYHLVSIDGGTGTTMIPEICHAEFCLNVPAYVKMEAVIDKIDVILRQTCPSGGVEINYSRVAKGRMVTDGKP